RSDRDLSSDVCSSYLASRHHLDNISWVLNEAFVQAAVREEDVQGIGVTYGPGLVGSLLVGLNAAKALSFSWKIPFVGINHLEAHLHSIFLEHHQAELPMLSIIASGGQDRKSTRLNSS